KLLEMLAHLDAGHGGVDALVVRAGLLRFRVTEALGIERIDLSHAPAQPDGNHVLGLAADPASGWCCGGKSPRQGSSQRGCTRGLQKVSSMHEFPRGYR